MAVSFRNNMNCHLYVKGISIILIEYFYYSNHSWTIDLNYWEEWQYIFQRNKICTRICRYASNACVQNNGIMTEQSALWDLALSKEWRTFIHSVSACVFTTTFIVFKSGFLFTLLCERTYTIRQRNLTLLRKLMVSKGLSNVPE